MSKLLAISTLSVLFFAVSVAQAQNEAASETDGKSPATETAQSEDKAAGADDKAAARASAETEFAARLTGATLVGNFTIDAAGPVEPSELLKPDRYELATVNKVNGDFWLFVYVHKGVPIPLTMKVLWAGKTPVLTLDEFTIAGMGTYSARLMFHGDRYAGTWQHGKKGGLMFGKIETAKFKKSLLNKPPRKVQPPKQTEPEIKPE